MTEIEKSREIENGGKIKNLVVKVIVPAERQNLAWLLGGSLITSSLSYDKDWITREEYDEYGPSVVQSKCTLYR